MKVVQSSNGSELKLHVKAEIVNIYLIYITVDKVIKW